MGLNKIDAIRYCELLREGRLRSRAAEELEIPYHEIAKRRRLDKAFAAEEQMAVEVGEDTRLDNARTESWRRGVEGVEEPVYYQGERVDTVRKFSDSLLVAELKRLDPRYNDRLPPDKSGGPRVQIVIAGMLEPRVSVREVAGGEARALEDVPAAPAPRALPP
jgi:hypothetical protein